jgi:heterodisulfide reductase subunit C
MVKSENLTEKFKEDIKKIPGGERLLNCYLCGTCTAGCPVSEIDESFNPRKIMRKILLGMKDDVLASEDIWLCQQCHTCVAHCPQDVRFADIIDVLREMAVKEGYVDADIAEKIQKTDSEIKELWNKKKKEILKK